MYRVDGFFLFRDAHMKPLQITLLLLLSVTLAGCKSEPQFSKVSGTVTKNGQPVARVEVRFVPLDEKLNKFIGAGITDEEGKYTIAIPGREEDVCCTGQSKVMVREAPIPDEIRGQLQQDEGRGAGNMSALQQYKASLKNRPIPKSYGVLHSTPLKADIAPVEDVYDIELK